MPKLVLLLTKKPGTTLEQFKHYFETVHVPEACRRIPAIKRADYRRNYISQTVEPGADRAPIDFDVITEITFASQADFDSFAAALSEPANAEWIVQDALKYADPGKTRSYLVDERVSQ